MLTKITAYSQWTNIEPLVLNIINRPDTDLFEVRDIIGLGPVKADVNTTPKGSVDGTFFSGANVGERNIVLTLGLNPDWNEWTVSRLRRLLDKYFMSKQTIRLVFETMEFSPVEISGYIESNEPNMFSKDPEHQISIICPDLYFKSVDQVHIDGVVGEDPLEIDYEGNIETGITVSVMRGADLVEPTLIGIRVMDPFESSIEVDHGASSLVAFHVNLNMRSIPGEKYVRNVVLVGGIITNLLNEATITNRWPIIGPGTTTFEVYSNAGAQNWALTYNSLFGSL